MKKLYIVANFKTEDYFMNFTYDYYEYMKKSMWDHDFLHQYQYGIFDFNYNILK